MEGRRHPPPPPARAQGLWGEAQLSLTCAGGRVCRPSQGCDSSACPRPLTFPRPSSGGSSSEGEISWETQEGLGRTEAETARGVCWANGLAHTAPCDLPPPWRDRGRPETGSPARTRRVGRSGTGPATGVGAGAACPLPASRVDGGRPASMPGQAGRSPPGDVSMVSPAGGASKVTGAGGSLQPARGPQGNPTSLCGRPLT